MKNYCYKQYMLFFTFFTAIGICDTAVSAMVKIKNNLAPIQLGATIYDNAGKPGQPSINIWAPETSGSGITILPNETFSYPNELNNGDSAAFGIQVNSARIPGGGGQCDQLCNHIQVTISQNGQTCSAANISSGTCGANQNSPRWQAVASVIMSNNVCTVTLKKANISSFIVCSCQYGAYPCTNSIQCGPGSANPICPAEPPYHW